MPADLHQSFLRDICERPRDDFPRLVYADYLEDQGAPKHAQFIRFQIEAYKLANDPRFDDHIEAPGCVCECRLCVLLKQADAILNTNTTQGRRRHLWAGRLRDFWGITYDYERGFVTEATCTSDLWKNWGKLIVLAQPVTRLRFRNFDYDSASPWATPELDNGSVATEMAWSAAAVAWAREQAGLPPLASESA